MKKRRILFSWLLPATMLTTVFATSCANNTTATQNPNTINNPDSNEANSSYVTINFVSDDVDVTFEGSTSIKTRSGKMFGQINPPIAKKTGAEFDHWYYFDEGTGEQVTVEPTTILSSDLKIYPLFTEFVPTTYVSVSFNDNDSILTGPTVSVVAKGTTFGYVPKPTASRSGWSFIGWYDAAEGGSEISAQTIIYDNITVYAHFISGARAYPESLNITAISDKLTIELRTEGSVTSNSVGCFIDYDESTIKSFPTSVSINKGQTINIICGGGSGPGSDPVPFSIDADNYRHFIIHGKAEISGSLEGLIDYGCDSTTTPDSTTLPGDYCYYDLFKDATPTSDDEISISQGIVYQTRTLFPASTLTQHCYENMFEGCNGIKTIPLTTLSKVRTTADYCFAGMFSNCKDLIDIPSDLLMYFETSAGYCKNMFDGCSQLKKIPSGLLSHASQVKENAFDGIFANTGLTKIPEDIFNYSATVYGACYENMFKGCKGITSIPEDFFGRFEHYTTAMFAYMFEGTSISSIPENLFTYPGVDNLYDYMYQGLFKDCEKIISIPSELFPWESLQTKASIGTGCLSNMFEGCTGITSIPHDLLHSITFLTQSCFKEMFKGCTGLKSLPSDLLPWTDLYTPYVEKGCPYPEYGFAGMFSGCSNLETIPSGLLPSYHVPQNCYQDMFSGCTKITSIPEGFLPASELDGHAYEGMFEGCTKLTSIPENLLTNITTSSMSAYACARMFKKCTSLTQLPVELLPAKPASDGAYDEMFAECTGLTSIHDGFFVETVSNKSFYSHRKMFYKCTSLKTLPSTFLPKIQIGMGENNFESMFEGCSSIEAIPVDFFNGFTLLMGQYNCYRMFKDCISLTSISTTKSPLLANSVFMAKKQYYNMYAEMFAGCTNLTSIDPNIFSIINSVTADKRLIDGCLLGMFKGCSKLTITQDNDTAGTLLLDLNNGFTITSGTDSLKDMFTGCNCVGFSGTPTPGHKYYLS